MKSEQNQNRKVPKIKYFELFGKKTKQNKKQKQINKQNKKKPIQIFEKSTDAIVEDVSVTYTIV